MNRPVGTFVRDGVTREAYTPGEAVALRAAGWREQTPPAEPAPQGPETVEHPRTHHTHKPDGADASTDASEGTEASE